MFTNSIIYVIIFPVPCIDNDNNCQFLNDFSNICNNTHAAKEHCQLFCGLCQAGRLSKLANILAWCRATYFWIIMHTLFTNGIFSVYYYVVRQTFADILNTNDYIILQIGHFSWATVI